MGFEIRYCTSPDGVRIAYSVRGDGPPFLWIPGWISHQELDYEAGEALGVNGATAALSWIAIDKRGTGLSGRNCQDYSLDARIGDVEAVVNHAGLTAFALGGWSEGGPIALAYAARHPEQVTKLVIMGSYAHGDGLTGDPALRDAILGVIKASWGMGSKLLADVFLDTDSVLTADAFAQYQQAGASAADAHAILSAAVAIDVRDLLPGIQAPTLVIQGRDDRVVPIALGQEVAAGVRGARFVSLPGGHVPNPDVFVRAFRTIAEFVAPADQAAPAQPAATAGGLVTLMFTDIEGSTAMTRRLGDEGAQEVLREHNRMLRDSLAAHQGREIKHTGDGIMASFARASSALDCAIAVQQAFAAYNDERPGATVRVRIGINAGEPVAEDNDLFGTSVQLAARICARADPGQVLVSNVVRELAAGKQYLFADIGDAVLRGFEDPARLFELRTSE